MNDWMETDIEVNDDGIYRVTHCHSYLLGEDPDTFFSELIIDKDSFIKAVKTYINKE